MLFPTIEFILFALLTLFIWWHSGIISERKRLVLLSIFNLVFYSNINVLVPVYLLMWVLILYVGSRWWKTGALLFGVGQLIFWKSIDVQFIELDWRSPLGLSFFTFQGLTYLFGVWRVPKSKPEYHISEPWSLLKIFAFVGFFPTLLSGPILRAAEWRLDVHSQYNMQRVNKSLSLILLGFLYKICLSGIFHEYSTEAFTNPGDTSANILLMGMYGYTFEIYTDFAGYSLMAMGVAHLYGFDVPFNFDRPYFTLNIRVFWTKWHITFSSWLRDYVYIPLGGSRLGTGRHYFNLMSIMVLCGIWHGFTSNYLIWGILQGVGIVGTHLIGRRFNLPSILSWFLTFHFICISWIVFRSADANSAFIYIRTLYSGLTDISLSKTEIMSISLMVVTMAIQYYERNLINWLSATMMSCNYITMVISWSLLFIGTLMLSPAGMPPFIYFNY